MWREIVTFAGGGGAALWLAYLTWLRDRGSKSNADGRLNLDSLTSTVDRLDREVTRLDRELDEERAARKVAEARAEAAEKRTGEVERTAKVLAKRVTAQDRRIAQLEGVMGEHQIPVPEPEPDPS